MSSSVVQCGGTKSTVNLKLNQTLNILKLLKNISICTVTHTVNYLSTGEVVLGSSLKGQGHETFNSFLCFRIKEQVVLCHRKWVERFLVVLSFK